EDLAVDLLLERRGRVRDVLVGVERGDERLPRARVACDGQALRARNPGGRVVARERREASPARARAEAESLPEEARGADVIAARLRRAGRGEDADDGLREG